METMRLIVIYGFHVIQVAHFRYRFESNKMQIFTASRFMLLVSNSSKWVKLSCRSLRYTTILLVCPQDAEKQKLIRSLSNDPLKCHWNMHSFCSFSFFRFLLKLPNSVCVDWYLIYSSSIDSSLIFSFLVFFLYLIYSSMSQASNFWMALIKIEIRREKTISKMSRFRHANKYLFLLQTFEPIMFSAIRQ